MSPKVMKAGDSKIHTDILKYWFDQLKLRNYYNFYRPAYRVILHSRLVSLFVIFYCSNEYFDEENIKLNFVLQVLSTVVLFKQSVKHNLPSEMKFIIVE